MSNRSNNTVGNEFYGLKVGFIGGVKSGKSVLAETRTLELSGHNKPYYLATAEIIDGEMAERVRIHKERRKDKFITIEEPLNIYDKLNECDNFALVEDLTVWMNNMLYHNRSKEDIYSEMRRILESETIRSVFVINDVGSGIIPMNKLTREFVDISGVVSQMLGKYCDEYYLCSSGLKLNMKP